MSTKIRISTPTANNGSFKKNVTLLLLAFGAILLVLALVYFIRRMIANRKAQQEISELLKGKTQPPNSAGGVRPDGSPNNVPSGGSNGGSGQTPGGGSAPQPSTLPEWLVTLLWKSDQVVSKTNYSTHQKMQYACEVSNNIMGITLEQVRLLKTTYQQWYGRQLVDDLSQWQCGGGTFDFGCPNTCATVKKRLISAG